MPEEYLTKDVAAKRSKRSARRLLELAAAGRIRKIVRPDPKNGHRAIALFHKDDIMALAHGDGLPPAALQKSAPVRPVAALPQPVASVIPPTPWLTLAEAEAYTGLPQLILRHLIHEGKLPALHVGVRAGGQYRVAKRDLDAIAGENQSGR